MAYKVEKEYAAMLKGSTILPTNSGRYPVLILTSGPGDRNAKLHMVRTAMLEMKIRERGTFQQPTKRRKMQAGDEYEDYDEGEEEN